MRTASTICRRRSGSETSPSDATAAGSQRTSHSVTKPPLDLSLWHAKLAPLEPLDGARDLLARLGVLLELVVEIAFPGPRLSRLAQRLLDEIPEIFGEPPRDGKRPGRPAAHQRGGADPAESKPSTPCVSVAAHGTTPPGEDAAAGCPPTDRRPPRRRHRRAHVRSREILDLSPGVAGMRSSQRLSPIPREPVRGLACQSKARRAELVLSAPTCQLPARGQGPASRRYHRAPATACQPRSSDDARLLRRRTARAAGSLACSAAPRGRWSPGGAPACAPSFDPDFRKGVARRLRAQAPAPRHDLTRSYGSVLLRQRRPPDTARFRLIPAGTATTSLGCAPAQSRPPGDAGPLALLHSPQPHAEGVPTVSRLGRPVQRSSITPGRAHLAGARQGGPAPAHRDRGTAVARRARR